MNQHNDKEKISLKQISPYRWEVPIGTVPGMRTRGEIIASPRMIDRIIEDRTPLQVANVATLPGIVGVSLAMPDIHWGYGFPIGGVAAFDLEEGVISPGGVGYDINCGVCLVATNLKSEEVKPRIEELVETLFHEVPCGVGSEGKIRLTRKDYDRVMRAGARWVVEYGLAVPEDLEHMEEGGCLEGSDPSLVSERARERAERQLGTLGSGNHFLEVQEVKEIYHPEAAQTFGLFPGQVVVMIHSGSRGLGHQICDETLKIMQGVVRREGFNLPDRQLACAPIKSREGQDYLAAMKCAANFAWANRLAMVGLTRKAFEQIFNKSWQDLGMKLIYDVAHNIAKIEEYEIDGKRRKVCV
ncbi:MAG: RtcB family protein, partial [bacterium]